jgi:hypothetical protein
MWRVIHEVLHPKLTEPESVPDTYSAAVRKIYRMRKPMFLASLWLRARFDVEYLGLTLPGVPGFGDPVPLIEKDMDVIGASHTERLEAERLRLKSIHLLRWVGRLLSTLEFDFPSLKDRLSRDFPQLLERRSEVIRALTIAYLVDYDDIRSLSAAWMGVSTCMEYAADVRSDLTKLPSDLPPFATPASQRWRPGHRRWTDRFLGVRRLFRKDYFPTYQLWQQRRIRKLFSLHHALIYPWVDVLLTQVLSTPQLVLEQRMLDIIRRVDLWSDQLVTLRTIQTLTLLDIDHYCRLVWHMGQYQELQEVVPEEIEPVHGNAEKSTSAANT